MGYTTIAYAVDLAQLEDACRPGLELPPALVAAATADAEQFSEWPVSMVDALQMIIERDFSEQSTEAKAQRLYAYQLLCEQFGKRLDGEGHIKFLEDLSWDVRAETFRAPFGLESVGPMPHTSYLTPSEVNAELDRLQDLDAWDNAEAWQAEAREEYVWWLAQCRNLGLSCVVLTH